MKEGKHYERENKKNQSNNAFKQTNEMMKTKQRRKILKNTTEIKEVQTMEK